MTPVSPGSLVIAELSHAVGIGGADRIRAELVFLSPGDEPQNLLRAMHPIHRRRGLLRKRSRQPPSAADLASAQAEVRWLFPAAAFTVRPSFPDDGSD